MVWGPNHNGVCGLGDEEPRLTPEVHPAFHGKRVLHLDTKNAHQWAMAVVGE